MPAVQSTQEAMTVIDRFLREGPRKEVAPFRPLWKAAIKRGGLRQTHKGKVTDEWKWLVSLQLWDAYQNGNKQHALEALREWLDIDCAFFLRQWWVSELVASWHKEQDWKKIERLFRGQRGKRQLQNQAEEYRRDQQIVVAVEKHLLQNSYREARKRASEELPSLGLTKIGEEGVRRVYEKAPLLPRTRYAPIYFAVKKLQAYGYTDKEAEQEVAAHPDRYGISEPLSPALVHSIYSKYADQFFRGARGQAKRPRSVAQRSLKSRSKSADE
jgi:hypothetical protein